MNEIKDGLFIPGEPLIGFIIAGILVIIVGAFALGYMIGKSEKPK